MKGFGILLLIGIVILFGPTIFKYLGQFFTWAYRIISLTGYKGIL